MKKFLLIVSLIAVQSAFSQQADFLKIKKYRVNYLNDKIEETSGLNILNGKLYTFNDSGNPAELFEIDKKLVEEVEYSVNRLSWYIGEIYTEIVLLAAFKKDYSYAQKFIEKYKSKLKLRFKLNHFCH